MNYKEQDYEHQHAIQEGYCNKAEDEYFNARPNLGLAPDRQLFTAGFDRGWEAAIALNAPADRDVMRQAPEGWKWVPVEPTEEMIKEGRCHDGEHTARSVWRDMLAAAPTPPAERRPDEFHCPLCFDDPTRLKGSEPVERYNERLFTVVANAYQILGALDAPVHILDVLSDPLGASEEQVEAMLPYVPAEQQPVAHFAVHTCPGGEFEYVQVESEGRGTIPLYTRPAPSLATLRAKVEALPADSDRPGFVWRKTVLAEIDKLGGGHDRNCV